MNDLKADVLAKSESKVFDDKHRKTIAFNIDKYNAAVENGKLQYSHLEFARKKAKNLKWKAIESLDKSLETFEKKFTERGGKVIWAEDAEDALRSEEHTSELQSRENLVCRLLLEKKKD